MLQVPTSLPKVSFRSIAACASARRSIGTARPSTGLSAGLLPALPSVTLRGEGSLERLRNGVEMGPNDLVAPFAGTGPIVRLLTPEGDLAGLAKPAKTAGFLHGWVVLG